jgi:CheY-like chemotaxis protein
MKGLSARFFTSPLEALAAARLESPDLVISDVAMPGISGVDLAIQMRAQYPRCKILLFSGRATTLDLLEDSRAHSYGFRLLQKPVHPSEFLYQKGRLSAWTSRRAGMENNGHHTVVIADDNREILKVLASLLQPSHRIIAQAVDGETALRAIQTHQPELAILDISMPAMNGLEVARRLRAAHSSTKVVFLTLQTSSDFIEEARRCANGYITKMRLHSDLYPAMDAALGGEFFVSNLPAWWRLQKCQSPGALITFNRSCFGASFLKFEQLILRKGERWKAAIEAHPSRREGEESGHGTYVAIVNHHLGPEFSAVARLALWTKHQALLCRIYRLPSLGSV